MAKFRVLLEIEVDKDIDKKYPNFALNYDDAESFVESLIDQWTDVETREGGEDYGFRVNCIKNYKPRK